MPNDRLTIAAARPGVLVDQQVLIAAQSMDDAQRSNPVWLWYSEDAVTFGRWQKRPNQAPYVRADLICATATRPDTFALERIRRNWP